MVDCANRLHFATRHSDLLMPCTQAGTLVEDFSRRAGNPFCYDVGMLVNCTVLAG